MICFLIGAVFGGIIGIGTMAILQIHHGYNDEKEYNCKKDDER